TAEAHRSAGHRIDGDADFALDDEEHVVGSIEIGDDRISRPAAAPGATLLQALASLGAEPSKDGDAFERHLNLLRLLVRCLGHCRRPVAPPISARAAPYSSPGPRTRPKNNAGSVPGKGGDRVPGTTP